MAEAQDAVFPRGADRVDVRTDAVDMIALLRTPVSQFLTG
jgi:hypothetical protein